MWPPTRPVVVVVSLPGNAVTRAGPRHCNEGVYREVWPGEIGTDAPDPPVTM